MFAESSCLFADCYVTAAAADPEQTLLHYIRVGLQSKISRICCCHLLNNGGCNNISLLLNQNITSILP